MDTKALLSSDYSYYGVHIIISKGLSLHIACSFSASATHFDLHALATVHMHVIIYYDIDNGLTSYIKRIHNVCWMCTIYNNTTGTFAFTCILRAAATSKWCDTNHMTTTTTYSKCAPTYTKHIWVSHIRETQQNTDGIRVESFQFISCIRHICVYIQYLYGKYSAVLPPHHSPHIDFKSHQNLLLASYIRIRKGMAQQAEITRLNMVPPRDDWNVKIYMWKQLMFKPFILCFFFLHLLKYVVMEI